MKMRFLILVVLLSSLCGGVVGAVAVYEVFLHRTQDVVRARQIQIEDANGVVKASLAAEHDGSTFLRFLGSDNHVAIRIGEQNQGITTNAGSDPASLFEFKTKDGVTALRMSVDSKDNGVVAFSDRKREDTMLLGRFPLQTDFASGSPKYEWGLHIKREHGETGVGIVDSSNLPVDYLSPVPHGRP